MKVYSILSLWWVFVAIVYVVLCVLNGQDSVET